MSRETGAVCRMCRRSGDKLFLKGDKCVTKCVFEKRPKAPGPQLGRPRRLSDRGQQLRQKQSIRWSYGMTERQFRRFFGLANAQPGVTGDNMMILLERRLDNVLFRLGFGTSRAQARQIVMHGHILVNGQKTDIPSYLIKEGQVITVRETSKATAYFKTLAENIEAKAIPGWLSLDRKTLSGKVISLPAAGDIDARFDAQTVVEYYSR
ncbi:MULTISPECIES: 30S ribosomal protein S4 [Dehalococcoides]|uniref:Small ribosomal subunit protein uS4 n=1 Tax=Dehalococcoides mccartyi (strain VS) TaxID=311424 RepID=D2BGZ7_DEHMV|nr:MULTISPECIES: 30S ribosomal protein S4 [Dehalococcoides]ACZ61597.1 ribosomal protein S4 [Dehalococcoides mccartyi VS]AII57646.1 30S ribosomal protein S4 [Dehalococcoides mccartyi CG1]APH12129.1 30S ribosomal protein S4 [Dehalococcoides mccartyi]QYY58266.1 30S ribosomal protein S4 [Dehalococcoides mccartyi]BAQ34388.1 30S ribosomal protein S4 [Dehalococcoides sp. UCH007]